MKKNKKLLTEIEEAKAWIEWNEKFVSALSRNMILDHKTQEERPMNENELFLKPTWIINNLMTQTAQHKLILANTKKILSTI